MPFGFFGLVIKPGKTYTQKVSRPFRITMATYGETVTEGGRSCVKVEIEGETYVLCSLSVSRVEQQPLDVVFEVNDKITFSSSGENLIYLTGNYLPDESDEEYESDVMDSEEMDSDECEDELDSDEEITEDTLRGLRAAIGQDDSFDSDDDEEDDSDFVELEAEEDEDESISSDISEVEHDAEEADSDKAESGKAMELDSEKEECIAVATGSKRKAAQKSPQQSEKKLKDNAAAAISASSAKSPAKKAEKLRTAAPVSSAADADSTPKKAPEDKAQKKVVQSAPPKTAAAATPSRQVEVPTQPNTEQKTKRQRKAERKKAKMAAMAEAGQAAAAVADKNNKLNETSTAVSPKKTFDNGLIIDDVKIGTGAIAAKGKKVTVRYIGKLVKNGKVFDKNVNGKPFSFVLGEGEVIKGWDLGFEHMKVGGERRLIIPGPLAYGSRGAPPDIPKNAALEFEVKLLKVE